MQPWNDFRGSIHSKEKRTKTQNNSSQAIARSGLSLLVMLAEHDDHRKNKNTTATG
jgi:hypothetical protein